MGWSRVQHGVLEGREGISGDHCAAGELGRKQGTAGGAGET